MCNASKLAVTSRILPSMRVAITEHPAYLILKAIQPVVLRRTDIQIGCDDIHIWAMFGPTE